MICPNCNKEMKNRSFHCTEFKNNFTTFEDWNNSGSSSYLNEEHICICCGIVYTNGVFKIPANIDKATEKQIKTVLFINNQLGAKFKPIFKKQCSNIISRYLNKAIDCADKKRERRIKQWSNPSYEPNINKKKIDIYREDEYDYLNDIINFL